MKAIFLLLVQHGLGERFKCAPTRHPAYNFAEVKETSVYYGGTFSVTSGVSCNTAHGYTGTPEGVMCTHQGEIWTLKGCQAACTQPTKNGYVIPSAGLTTNNREFGSFVVRGWACAEGFSGNPVASRCSATTGGDYELSGCKSDCTEPGSWKTTGYRKRAGGLIQNNPRFYGFNVLGWECDKDNFFGGHANAHVCSEEATDYSLSGCTEGCREPTETTGYKKPSTGLTEIDRFFDGFKIEGWQCAAGFSGTAVASRCARPGDAYVLSGCLADCSTPVFSGYVNSPGYTKNLAFENFSYAGAVCDSNGGYSGTAVVNRCPSPGTDFVLSGCTKCAPPVLSLKAYSLSENLAWTEFSVSGYACADNFEGTPEFTRCSSGGTPYSVSGCTEKCRRPNHTGYKQGDQFNEELKLGSFSVSGWECADGYSGDPQTIKCDKAGTEYTLSGCVQDCIKPTTTLGYVEPEDGLSDKKFAFDDFLVTGYQCDGGFSGTPTVEKCQPAGTPYILKDCVRDVVCIHPSGPLISGYNVDHSKSIVLVKKEFNIPIGYWTCSAPYVQNKEIKVTACTESDTTYTLSGCAKPCRSLKGRLPDGYVVAANESFDEENRINHGTDTTHGFKGPTGLECASGYGGTVEFTTCPSPDTDYTISGCQRDCSHPTSVIGYKQHQDWTANLSNMNLSSSSKSFDIEKCSGVACWECDASAGYGWADSGKKVKATVCMPGGRYSLSGCAKLCKEPVSFPWYKKPANFDSEKLARGDFEVKDWGCADGASGTAKAEVCTNPGEEYILSGCIEHCEAQDPWPLGYKKGNDFEDTFKFEDTVPAGISCDDGYSGTVAVTKCTETHRQYILKGCYKDCKRPLRTPGYKIKDDADETNEKLEWDDIETDDFWECAEGYHLAKSKTEVEFETCYDDNDDNTGTKTEFYGLLNCLPDAIEPTLTASSCYEKGDSFAETSSKQKDFDVTGYQCSDACEKVSENDDPSAKWSNGEWELSGCRPKCQAPIDIPIGYVKKDAEPTCSTNGDSAFTLEGWGCDKQAGFSGSPSGKRAKMADGVTDDTQNQIFLFDGCYVDCLEPDPTPGYRLTAGGATSDDKSYGSFKVEGKWECDTSVEGLTGTAVAKKCDPNGKYKLSGCHHTTCTTPDPIPAGYKKADPFTETEENKKWAEFDATALASSWSCADGFSLASDESLTVTKCSGFDSQYLLSKCYPDAGHPKFPAGYEIDDPTKTIKLGYKDFDIPTGYFGCAEGYSKKSDGIEANYDPTVSSFYTLSGCDRDCSEPRDHPGYTKTKGLVKNQPKFNSFKVDGWECSSGYSSPDGFGMASVCPFPGEEYKLSGCVKDCVPPEDTTGYVLDALIIPKFNGWSVEETAAKKNSCAPEFSGNPELDVCDSPGGPYKVSGCNPTMCENPSTTGYSRKSYFNPSLAYSSFSAASYWKCSPGWSGDVTATKCSGGTKKYSLDGCSQDCKEPSVKGYVKRFDFYTSTSNTASFKSFSISGWACDLDQGYTGTAVASKCSSGGEPYTLSGCEQKCTRPEEVINVAYKTNDQATYTCGAGYYGSAVSQCSDGATKLSGCLPLCEEPASTLGYKKPSGGLTVEVLQPQKFDVAGWGCAPGFSGSASVTVCNENSITYFLSGCFADCIEPPSTGYLKPDASLDSHNLAYFGFSVDWSCSEGYSGDAKALRCVSGQEYSLIGCSKNCIEPASSPNGYLKPAGGLSKENLQRHGFAVEGWECSWGYSGRAVAQVCPAGGTEYTLTGCHQNCGEPSQMIGYKKPASFTTNVPNQANFEVVGWTCAEGYSGNAVASVCSWPGAEYHLSGCRKDCVAPTNTPGYVRGPNMRESLQYVGFDVSGWNCVEGYTGFPDAQRCAGTEADFVYGLSGCYQDCISPLFQPGYIIDNPSGDFTFTPPFSVTGVTCTDHDGPAVVSVCNAIGGNYWLSGCGITVGRQDDDSDSDDPDVLLILGVTALVLFVLAVVAALAWKELKGGTNPDDKKEEQEASIIPIQMTGTETSHEATDQ